MTETESLRARVAELEQERDRALLLWRTSDRFAVYRAAIEDAARVSDLFGVPGNAVTAAIRALSATPAPSPFPTRDLAERIAGRINPVTADGVLDVLCGRNLDRYQPWFLADVETHRRALVGESAPSPALVEAPTATGERDEIARMVACIVWATLDGDEPDEYEPLLDELLAGRRRYNNQSAADAALAAYKRVHAAIARRIGGAK